MNILYITPEFSTSKDYLSGKSLPMGMPGQTKFLEYLKDSQHNTLVLAQMKNGDAGFWKERKLVVHYFPWSLNNIIMKAFLIIAPISARKVDFLLTAIMKYSIVNFFNPDIVYGCWYYGAGVGKIFSIIHRCPLVVRMFGTGLTRYLPDFDLINDKKRRDKVYFDIFPFTLSSDAMVITEDGTNGDKVAIKLGYPISKLNKLYNGFDFKPINKNKINIDQIKKKYNVPKDKFIITYTGRLAGWKRTDRLIRVFNELCLNDKNLILLLGGFGRDENAILSYAESHGIKDNVIITGQLVHKEIAEILCLSEIHLSLNDLTNLTNTTIEAMGVGCCVVAVDAGETSDLIKNNQNGTIVSKNINEIVLNIRMLINDSEKRKLLGNNAAKTIENNFHSWDKRIRQELTILESLMP